MLQLAVGLALAETTEAAREATHALHALLAEAMGFGEELKPGAETVGSRQEDWKCKKLNFFTNIRWNFTEP